jgi:hypothetical protein
VCEKSREKNERKKEAKALQIAKKKNDRHTL